MYGEIKKYVIVYYSNGKIKYLADPDLTDQIWTYNIRHAKKYIDISAAEIKAGNIKYGMNPVNAQVKYINRDGRLFNVKRRDTYGRR